MSEMREMSKLCKVSEGFRKEMEKKLIFKCKIGYRGWADKSCSRELRRMLLGNAVEITFDPPYAAVDIANLSMMLWWQGLKNKDKERVMKGKELDE